jgi:signal transduction histidine kinase
LFISLLNYGLSFNLVASCQPGISSFWVCGNILMAAGNFAIASCLAYIYLNRKDFPFRRLALALAAYLVGSGATHISEVVSLLTTGSSAMVALHVVSALIGIGTSVVFMCIIPQMLKIPGRDELTGQIKQWKRSEQELRELQMHLEERVRERTTELESRNDDLSQFAFAASHDLQEPLRMMALYSELLHQRYEQTLDADAKTYLEQVVGGARRMSRLLDDLLAYTKLIRVNSESNDTPYAVVKDVLGHVMQDLNPQISLSEAQITWDELPVLRVSETHLRQLLQNLISNAIKYRSKARPKIHITSYQQGDEFLISIKDNGIGIGPAYHRHIFGVFKRLHGRELPGTGMGLPICQKIVERYGGRIWVESEIGRGATFSFRLPGFPAQAVGATKPEVRETAL